MSKTWFLSGGLNSPWKFTPCQQKRCKSCLQGSNEANSGDRSHKKRAFAEMKQASADEEKEQRSANVAAGVLWLVITSQIARRKAITMVAHERCCACNATVRERTTRNKNFPLQSLEQEVRCARRGFNFANCRCHRLARPIIYRLLRGAALSVTVGSLFQIT